VADRSFRAQLRGASADQVGHPWPVARFGGYRLTDGTPPAADREIVVAHGRARTGEVVTVLTADGITEYTVSGTVEPVGWEDAVFFTEAKAARLSPRVDGLVALGPPGQVRAAVGSRAEVLTGPDRHRADAGEARDREALDNTRTLVPVMAGVAGITAIFVVASTFAFAVVQRRRLICGCLRPRTPVSAVRAAPLANSPLRAMAAFVFGARPGRNSGKSPPAAVQTSG
jgi:putative ABC transport system permease protein